MSSEPMLSLRSFAGNNSVAYVNGRVYTMDQSQPWASAFIVSPMGAFEAVGTDGEISAAARQRCLVTYDLRQQFVMPGIHDAHTHLLMASMQQLNEVNIGFDGNAATIGPKLVEGSCACAYTNVFGDWIIGNFYDASQFPDNMPDRKYLDEQYPDQPVLVRDVSCHNILLNTAALVRCGIDVNGASDPEGGSFGRRPDGTLTGELIEGATRDVWFSLPIPPLTHVKRALEYGIEMCHRYGITSCQEASANTLYLHALRELEEEKRLNLTICTHIVCAPDGPPREPEKSLSVLLDAAHTFQSKHVKTRFVKFWLDGAPIPPRFTQCELDSNGEPVSEFLLLSWDKLFNAIKKYDARDMTCKVHVAGEGSVRRALDVYEKVREQNPHGPQHEIAHCNAIHPADLPRLAPLRITAEMSPAIFHHDICRDHPEIFKWPFNEVLASGAKLTIGSDWILTPNPSLFDALAGIVEKVQVPPSCQKIEQLETKTKKEIGGEILCRIITLGGAEAVCADKELGSIEVGKWANFIAVDRNLSEGEFEGAKVLKTWFEGRLVYSCDTDKK